MILNRPRGNTPETPDQLKTRLQRGWAQRVEQHLQEDTQSVTHGGSDMALTWPLEVNIGRPKLTGDAALQNALAIRGWIDAWRALEEFHDIRFETKTRRGLGTMRAPERIVFADIDRLAAFLGKEAISDLKAARARIADLEVIDPRLTGMAPHWRGLTQMSETEHAGACEFLRIRHFDQDDMISIREMVLKGLDGKFLERHNRILEDALSHMGKLREGSDFRERLGFRVDSRQTLWTKTHSSDLVGPFGAQQFAVRPNEIQHFPKTITRVSIVENVETFFSFDPEPGTCFFWGGGNAISGMAWEMRFLEGRDVAYWGDLDTYGMKILSRLRRAVPHARSVMMDAQTMSGLAKGLWRIEPESDRYTGEIDKLTEDEQAAVALLRSGNHRIEQEHLRPGPQELSSLGLCRVG